MIEAGHVLAFVCGMVVMIWVLIVAGLLWWLGAFPRGR